MNSVGIVTQIKIPRVILMTCESKHCIDCDMTIYYDELQPFYCDQCGKKL